MRYGHFDDAAKEYVIETPATPLPWINYLGNEDFFSLISNTGGGYSFYKDAKLRRITRYRYNNVPADNGSRCYYLSLMDSDSADAKPVETWHLLGARIWINGDPSWGGPPCLLPPGCRG